MRNCNFPGKINLRNCNFSPKIIVRICKCYAREVAFMIFKRKIYNKLLDWKTKSNGTKAILIEGARRIGKSTIAEEFGKNNY